MQQDMRLRAAAEAIYETCFLAEPWAAVSFDRAEAQGTAHYRKSVEAALRARGSLLSEEHQLDLL